MCHQLAKKLVFKLTRSANFGKKGLGTFLPVASEGVKTGEKSGKVRIAVKAVVAQAYVPHADEGSARGCPPTGYVRKYRDDQSVSLETPTHREGHMNRTLVQHSGKPGLEIVHDSQEDCATEGSRAGDSGLRGTNR